MPEDKQEFLQRLLETFRIEASEHLGAMSAGLLALERDPGAHAAETVETIFREAHSLKGAARAVGLFDVERLCHELESRFSGWMRQGLPDERGAFDHAHQTVDRIGLLVGSGGAAPPESPAPPVRVELPGVIDDRAVNAGSAEPRGGQARPPADPTAGTVRLSTSKLDAMMRRTEELLGPRLSSTHRLDELQGTRRWLAEQIGERHDRRARSRATGTVLRSDGDDAAVLMQLDAKLASLERAARADHRVLSTLVDCLLEDMREAQLLPFSTLVDGLRKLVRDLARERGKDAELTVRGGDVTVDRRILEQVKSPLQHLLRNCVDHGIEAGDVRQRRGKPAAGAITITLARDHGNVSIVVADDGKGVNAEDVRSAAAKLGIDTANSDATSLVFESGLSTSPAITEVSGRGAGLAIVREKVERLGGSVTLQSRSGEGTTVRLSLPVTVATFRGVLVRAAGRRLLVSTASVERVARVPVTAIRSVEGRDTAPVDGERLPLVRLADVLGLVSGEDEPLHVHLLVVAAAGERVAFRVDEIIDEQEVVVRSLGPQLRRVRNLAGAGVLGTGEALPVLDVPDLMRAAARTRTAPEPEEHEDVPVRLSILVVEDSITSRVLFKSILESAGYEVTTAVDGMDGWARVREGRFDLVVSDVEMPRMDGFELTSKIRGDARLASLPVVLVTALDSPAHRERGLDAGANAYVVKSSFDQSNLLEIVRRLA
jgi:two-component system chemotaxis sensor kinase CheA